jgi:pyruvate-ferredoxin/flavodoxin oxidoreductase
MELVTKHLEAELERWEFFSAIPTLDPTLLSPNTVKGSQVRESLFEFSGACAGCVETPYLNLLTQLFGDRIIIANATGCSSIYGGNLPTTPWSYNSEGRGPAWANSLFEDNAEFGLGIHLGVERHVKQARQFLKNAASKVGVELANSILDASQNDDAGVKAQRERVAELKKRLELAMEEKGAKLNGEVALSEGADELSKLHQLSDYLVKKSVWIVGGDGWAYDIGFGGLEHVLASGANVNILVLDTEVYSNTGGQSSKATPRGAIAKFAAGGKHNPKMNLGMLGIELGEVYVAQVAIGANDIQTVKAFIEADAFPGPSLIIAYSSCVPAHGIEESKSMSSQSLAVKSGYWPLYRYHPGVIEHAHPFQLDSHTPSIPFAEYAHIQTRFSMPAHTSKAAAKQLLKLAQADIDEQWRYYEQLAGIERTVPTLPDKDWPGES